MSTALQLFNKSFPNDAIKSNKSQAYLSGVLDTLCRKTEETHERLLNRFALGTAEADAWNAGNRHGHDIWIDYKREVKS
jgi:hypothetical protein